MSTQLLGEFECKLDDKSRFILPAMLKKQLPNEQSDTFVINRGIENCLVLYPKYEWNQLVEKISQLNQFVKKNRDFVRHFYRGATELTLDSANRLLLPKTLKEYAGIQKDMIMTANINKMEIWDKSIYEKMLNEEPDDFSSMAEEVMGNIII
ncbi:MAG: division/cell wall cluster transcriptional repressor MraZ [Bacteroidota bacterium]|nr:division/cell wall cluster transcriptional repressor MraZ [Bacteroidota bacterium]